MFLQTSLQNRRKFLERSLRGAGGLLLLPMLFESCTDHDIPDPGDGDHPIFVSQFNWNDDSKIAITSMVEMIPVVGDLLGGVVDILWPSTQEDIWGDIKTQVEALVNQQIAAQVYQDVSDDLDGLKNSLTLYLNELKNGSPASILDQWTITRNLFVNALPHFQSAGNQLPLLPFFGQFVSLYLGLLRDAALDGGKWGMSPADQQQVTDDLSKDWGTFYEYTLGTFNAGLTTLANNTKTDYHNCQPFKSLNAYTRQMIVTVMDFANLWSYFDITLYPNGATDGVNLDREIYSDPFGSCDDSGAIALSPLSPSEFPTNVTVWGGDRIQSVQVTYPSGTGPGGATQTKGGAANGSNQPPLGGSFTLTPANPIVWGRATWGSIVNSMQLGYQDGTSTQMMGGAYIDPINKPNDTGAVGYPLEALSSIHINGVSTFYDSADCVVFGYEYWEAPTDKLNALRDIYVKTPKEHTEAELTKSLSSAVSANNLITDQLRTARKAYWDALKARAAALK